MLRKGGMTRVIMVTVLMLGVATSAAAQQTEERPVPKRYAVGLHGSFPAWGLSAMYDVNDRVTVQGVIDPTGVLKAYAGRVLYYVKDSFYGYGTAGLFTYGGNGVIPGSSVAAFGIGGGGGVEIDWQKVLGESLPGLPALVSHLELGFAVVNFNDVNYAPSTLTIGAGLHYRF